MPGIKVNVPVLKLLIKMLTWNLKYNPFCRLIFLFISECYYCNYLGWLLWGSTTILPPKQNISLVAQTKLLNIDPLVKRKLVSWCACMSVHAGRSHASGSWLRNKQIANMQGYKYKIFNNSLYNLLYPQGIWVASYQTHGSLYTIVCNPVCFLTLASIQPETMNKWINVHINKTDIHLHNTSKCVSGPYMSHIFLLLTSIPLPECWNIWTKERFNLSTTFSRNFK